MKYKQLRYHSCDGRECVFNNGLRVLWRSDSHTGIAPFEWGYCQSPCGLEMCEGESISIADANILMRRHAIQAT